MMADFFLGFVTVGFAILLFYLLVALWGVLLIAWDAFKVVWKIIWYFLTLGRI